LKEIINQWEAEKDKIETICKKCDIGDIDAMKDNARHGR